MIPHQRLHALALEIQLHQAQEQHDVILMTLFRQRQRERGRRRLRWWVKPWIMRRRLFGQYYTLFLKLERESRGDYIGYIRMNFPLPFLVVWVFDLGILMWAVVLD